MTCSRADLLSPQLPPGPYRIDGHSPPVAPLAPLSHFYYFPLPERQQINRESLLDALAAGLAFPDYFGGNWDAAFDCLTDQPWTAGAIVLIVLPIAKATEVDEKALTTLLALIQDAVLFWQGEQVKLYLLIDTERADLASLRRVPQLCFAGSKKERGGEVISDEKVRHSTGVGQEKPRRKAMDQKKIVLAVDESEHARLVVDSAIEYAKLLNAAVVLVYCHRKFPTLLGEPYRGNEIASIIREAENLVAPYIEQLKRENIPVEERLMEEPAGSMISDIARIEQCDLIIMGSRGLTNLASLIVGSVTNRVLQTAPCSVLVVR
jgi:nucleotide-binding universal stress UspA family protein/RNAse (barnase) inhibitor barstar